MNKLIWLLFPATIFAQKGETQIKANALTMPLAMVKLGVEHAITDRRTLQADGFISPWKSFAGNHLQMYMAFGEGRYYFDKSFSKFYIGPNIGVGFFDIQKWNYWNTDKYQRGVAILTGATIGYQVKINENWGLDVFVGGGHSQGNYKGYYKEDSPNFGRYDSAKSFNKSGEWILYKGGVMLTYKFKRKKSN